MSTAFPAEYFLQVECSARRGFRINRQIRVKSAGRLISVFKYRCSVAGFRVRGDNRRCVRCRSPKLYERRIFSNSSSRSTTALRSDRWMGNRFAEMPLSVRIPTGTLGVALAIVQQIEGSQVDTFPDSCFGDSDTDLLNQAAARQTCFTLLPSMERWRRR
jgi:hypothetical protein